jgi:hypothetical protein
MPTQKIGQYLIRRQSPLQFYCETVYSYVSALSMRIELLNVEACCSIRIAFLGGSTTTALGHKPPFYPRNLDRLECVVNQPSIHIPGECALSANTSRSLES